MIVYLGWAAVALILVALASTIWLRLIRPPCEWSQYKVCRRVFSFSQHTEDNLAPSQGTYCVISGASEGIGRAYASAMAQRGCVL